MKFKLWPVFSLLAFFLLTVYGCQPKKKTKNKPDFRPYGKIVLAII